MNKTIIIYHSYTGNTKKIVEQIKNKLKCDELELEPLTPFSTDYQTVVNEWQNNSIKDEVAIKPVEIDFSQYTNIIIGSPIWWYTITPVISTFLKTNNLEDKNIYPLFTSAGWFGHCVKDFKSLCKSKNIKKELKITFAEDYNLHEIVSNKQDIEKWIEEIK